MRLKILVWIFAAIVLSSTVRADPWPQFRGPHGNGISEAKGLPLTWSEKENVVWKTAIHGRGWSSPVVWGDQIWLTTATEDGTQLFAVCVDRQTGKIVRNLRLFNVVLPQYVHPFNSYASPTPVIEEGRVYVTFGSPGTACLDTATGKVLWERRDFVCNHFRGAGSSPILFGDLLIMNFDGSDHQFVVALDKQTGRTVWRADRSVDFKDLDQNGKPQAEGDFRKAFSTPHIAELNGMPVLLSQGAKAHYAYAPATGQELWRVEERTTHSASNRPVAGHGMVFFATGWSNGQLLALKPGKGGEVIDANADPAAGSASAATQLALVWKAKRSVSRKPGLILADGLLFMLEDGGIASCLDAKTGAEIWQERVGGNQSASPIHAEGRIYCFNEEGKASVINAGREYKVLAENHLEGGFMASPAVSGQSLIVRSKTHLYRIENRGAGE